MSKLLKGHSMIQSAYLLSQVLRLVNVGRLAWVDALSWLFVLQVAISQCFIWGRP